MQEGALFLVLMSGLSVASKEVLAAPTHLFSVTLGASSRADFPTGLADLGTRIAWLRNKVLVYIKYTHKIKKTY